VKAQNSLIRAERWSNPPRPNLCARYCSFVTQARVLLILIARQTERLARPTIAAMMKATVTRYKHNFLTARIASVRLVRPWRLRRFEPALQLATSLPRWLMFDWMTVTRRPAAAAACRLFLH
jgi:hypothetical protein